MARLAIKVAWERGVIAYINDTGSWNREARTFALTASAYPELDLSLSRDHTVPLPLAIAITSTVAPVAAAASAILARSPSTGIP